MLVLGSAQGVRFCCVKREGYCLEVTSSRLSFLALARSFAVVVDDEIFSTGGLEREGKREKNEEDG